MWFTRACFRRCYAQYANSTRIIGNRNQIVLLSSGSLRPLASSIEILGVNKAARLYKRTTKIFDISQFSVNSRNNKHENTIESRMKCTVYDLERRGRDICTTATDADANISIRSFVFVQVFGFSVAIYSGRPRASTFINLMTSRPSNFEPRENTRDRSISYLPAMTRWRRRLPNPTSCKSRK